MRNPKITVVVPIYNVEKYLAECLNSIIKQTFKDWECVLVDDGSIDNSGDICEIYVQKDSRFKVIHKKNGGLSSSRNVGLEVAKGEFISFIDSDDWIDKNFLSSLYNTIIKYDSDVVSCGYIKEYVSFRHRKKLTKEIILLEGKEIIEEFIKDEIMPNYAWNKLYKRKILTSGFPEGKVYEDIYAMTSWFDNIRKFAVIPDILYHYRMRRGSITKCKDSSLLFDYIEAILIRAEQIQLLLGDEFCTPRKNLYLYPHLVNTAKSIARTEKNPLRRKEYISKIIEYLRNISVLEKSNLNSKILKRGELLCENPNRFISKMRFMKTIDVHTKYRNLFLYD